jgi:putative glutamine amidotransferase
MARVPWKQQGFRPFLSTTMVRPWAPLGCRSSVRMLGFSVRMPPTSTTGSAADKPRIGIPWRTLKEQQQQKRDKLDYYFRAVAKAGGEPREVRLDREPEALQKDLQGLDAFILPGSPADVDPARYGAAKHPKTNELDENRDLTDFAILDHALKTSKPVLAICYGCQLLNVYRQGTLIQDIPAERGERPNPKPHGTTDLQAGAQQGDQWHCASLAEGSELAKLAGGTQAQINSSHHQAIDHPGDGLKVTAQSEDGIIEGVELNSPGNWVIGVQWHPERMVGDTFADRLFADFVAAACSSRGSVVQKT